MRLEHHLVGGYVRYISPYIIIIIRSTHAYAYAYMQIACKPRESLYL